MRHTYYVYLITNRSRTLYIGITNDIERRMFEHKTQSAAGFAQRYRCDRLVHVEDYARATDAIAREKQLKGWLRSRKVALVEETNPTWMDLSGDWFTQAELRGEPAAGRPDRPRPSS